MHTVFINGLLTGLILQAALGPVFFYLLNLSLQRTLTDGLYAVLAVTLADYLYITLAIAGVGRLLENKRTKLISGLAGSLILIIFGLTMILSANGDAAVKISNPSASSDYFSSFLSSFLLTISSPLTIVFWSGIFLSKSIEKNYSGKQLIIFGFSAGLATVIFLGLAVIIFTLFKSSIPSGSVNILNTAVGLLLIVYAVARFLKVLRGTNSPMSSGKE